MSRFVERVSRGVVLLLLVFSQDVLAATESQPGAQAGWIKINPNREQRISIMGGDMERSGIAVHGAANTDEILRWCISDINFNMFRVKYDKKQEMEEGVKTFDCYDLQIETMKAIRRLNPDIKFLATNKSDYNGYSGGNCNNFPTFIYDYSAKKGENGKREATGSRSFDAVKYGVFLADYVEHMYRKGVPIDFMATAKEYSSVVTPQRSHDAYRSMKLELFKRRVPVPKVIGPASWSIKQGVNYVKEVGDLGFEDEYAAFSSHDLGKQPHLWKEFVEVSAKLGKKAFNDESGAAAGGPIGAEEPDMAGLLNVYKRKCNMYESGLVGEIFFEIWSRGIGRESRAVYFARKGQDAWRKRSYYVMKEFANAAVNNYYCRSAVGVDNVSAMAFRDDSTMHLWLVNENTEPISGAKLSVEGGSIFHYLEHRYWDSDEAVPELKRISNRKANALSVDLPAQSLNYIRFKLRYR